MIAELHFDQGPSHPCNALDLELQYLPRFSAPWLDLPKLQYPALSDQFLCRGRSRNPWCLKPSLLHATPC